MDDTQHIGCPTRWIDARRAVRAIERRDGWTPRLTASGVASGIFHLTRDGRGIALTEVLQGVRMTHRLTAGEVAGGFLLLDPDLTVFEVPIAIGVRTTSGEPVSLATVATAGPPSPDRPPTASPRVAVGPDDWLDDLLVDDLVAVQLVDDTLLLSPVDDADGPAVLPADLVAAVRASSSAELGRGLLRVAQLLAVLVEVGMAHPDLLDGDADVPVGELLHACGLHHAHGWVTDEPTVELDAMVGPEQLTEPLEGPAAKPTPVALLTAAIARHRMGLADPYDGHRRQALAALDDPAAVLLVAAMTGPSNGIPRLVADLERKATRPRRAALQHLAAAHNLAHGRVQAGIDALQRSLQLEEGGIVRGRLAELRWMCGDHRAAATLDPSRAEAADQLRGEGAGWELEELLDAMPSYEDPGEDPVARARQLWRRARWYAQTTGGADLLSAQLRALRRHGPSFSFPPEALGDNVLEQFGGLARFAAEVGPLLPADEQQLLHRWLRRRRRWWRVRGFEGRAVVLDRLDGGLGTAAIGPWRAEDVADPDVIRGDLACVLVLPTCDPDVRILGGPLFSVPEETAPLPPPEDVLSVVAMMTRASRGHVGPGHLAA